MRLRPRPVSMLCAGSGVSVPIGSWSYCMKTRFQYSRKRSFSPPGRSSARAPLQAAVEVQLRARAARAGRAGLPEVLRARAQLDDPLARHADRLPDARSPPRRGRGRAPRRRSKTVTQMSSALEAEALDRQLPGELDRALLEVVADREVAEHLEERQVARGRADVLDVGGAEALLARRQARRGRLLEAEEVGLERVHPGGREQHRRVERGGHQRRRRAGAGGRAPRRSRGRSRGSRRTSRRRDRGTSQHDVAAQQDRGLAGSGAADGLAQGDARRRRSVQRHRPASGSAA